jgi:hypothetical protein
MLFSVPLNVEIQQRPYASLIQIVLFVSIAKCALRAALHPLYYLQYLSGRKRLDP